jgi:hypothetical protein
MPPSATLLFGPVSELQREIVTREIAACPGPLAPLEAVVQSLQVAADTMFEARRDANPELQERELARRAALADTLSSLRVIAARTPG